MRYCLASNAGKMGGNRTLFGAWPEEHSAPAVPYFMRNSCQIVDISLSVGCAWQTPDAQCRGALPLTMFCQWVALISICITFNTGCLARGARGALRPGWRRMAVPWNVAQKRS